MKIKIIVSFLVLGISTYFYGCRSIVKSPNQAPNVLLDKCVVDKSSLSETLARLDQGGVKYYVHDSEFDAFFQEPSFQYNKLITVLIKGEERSLPTLLESALRVRLYYFDGIFVGENENIVVTGP